MSDRGVLLTKSWFCYSRRCYIAACLLLTAGLMWAAVPYTTDTSKDLGNLFLEQKAPRTSLPDALAPRAVSSSLLMTSQFAQILETLERDLAEGRARFQMLSSKKLAQQQKAVSATGAASRRSKKGRDYEPHWQWSAAGQCVEKHPSAKQRLRILCLGDSITFGNGSHTRLSRPEPGGNYPLLLRADPVLRQYLCPHVKLDVENMGFNGCSAQEGKRCFRNTIVYRAALRKVRTADVVVIILGTNDAKDYNWKGPEAFEGALASYVDELRGLSHPFLDIMIGTPPPVFPNPQTWRPGQRPNHTAYHIPIRRVREEIRDSVIAVSEQTNTALVDIYQEVAEKLDSLVDAGARMEAGIATSNDVALVRHYYVDGVHPYTPTHEFVTAAVRDRLISLINSTVARSMLTASNTFFDDDTDVAT